jgi:hypothetical protein
LERAGVLISYISGPDDDLRDADRLLERDG